MTHLMRAASAAQRRRHPLILGCFSAASNVSGITLDIPAVSRILHGVGGLAMFDCAAYASHRSVTMNIPTLDPASHADAIFLSPHKWLGGPGAPGVLLAKRRLFRVDGAPDQPGGGTVEYVSRSKTVYSRVNKRILSDSPKLMRPRAGH